MALVPDDHDPAENDHYAEMRVEYVVGTETVNGELPITIGQVEQHIHHIPPSLYIDTLLLLAREALMKSMQENMFRDSVPDAVKGHASRLMATNFLVQRLQSSDLMESREVDFSVPDDARELFESGHGGEEKKGWPYS